MALFDSFLILASLFGAALAAAPSHFSNSTAPTATASLTVTPAPSICNPTTFRAYGLYSGYSTDPALQCHCLTQLDNWLLTSDPPTRTLTRSIGTGAITTTIVSGGATITETTEAIAVYTNTVTANFAYANENDWYGSATPPCCSSCTVAAATVNLFYWPTPAMPSAATSFVSNNFTFVSPSVYIGFTALSAFDFCGPVGKVFTSTTVAFAPGELSSVGSPIPTQTLTDLYTSTASSGGQLTTSTFYDVFYTGGPPSAINYQDLGQNCSTISGYAFVPGNPSQIYFKAYDPCHPTIILPSRVQSLDPAWATCVNNGIGGFYDPPYALTSLAALLPTMPNTPAPPASTLPFIPPPTAPPDVMPSSPASSTSPQGPNTASVPASTHPGAPNPTGNSAGDGGRTSLSSLGPPGTGDGAPSPSRGQTTAASPPQQNPSPIIIGGSTITPNSASQYIIGTQTLSPGGPAITTDGTTYSLTPASSGGNLVINGITQTQQPSIFAITGPALIISGSTITENSASQFVVGSQTLAPGGPALTVGGTTYSIPLTGSVVVVNGVTAPLATYTTTTTANGGGSGGAGGGGTVVMSSASGGASHAPLVLTANAASRSAVAFEGLLSVLVALFGVLVVCL